jgi:hypothetical protein
MGCIVKVVPVLSDRNRELTRRLKGNSGFEVIRIGS